MRTIIEQLKEAAEMGQEKIEDGDIYRCQLPDSVFDKIVTENKRDKVIEQMALSGEWYRHNDGFTLISALRNC